MGGVTVLRKIDDKATFLDLILGIVLQELAAPLSKTTVYLEVGLVGEGDVLGGEEMHRGQNRLDLVENGG